MPSNDNDQQRIPSSARRPVPYPVDVSALARAFADSGLAWCWLEGASEPGADLPGANLPGADVPGADLPSVAKNAHGRRIGYLGITREIRFASTGAEPEFLAELAREVDPPAAVREGARVEGRSGSGFEAGWVVAFAYEFGVSLIGLSPAPDAAPPAFALRLDAVVAVDDATGAAELRGGSEQAIDDWLAMHGPLLEGAAIDGSESKRALPIAAGARTPARWRRSDDEYAAEVDACAAAIRDGDAYVLCLTDTAEVRGRFDPLDIYERVRRSGDALRGGVIVAGERALVSASPERFLGIRGRRIETHPIKGTRPRGTTPVTDAALAAELAADPKERAENLMIVDLMRNDLSRICRPDSVTVEGFLRVETHPHVHQLVSTVAGELRPGLGVFDAVASCFPGGSMTGAPKHRAVEILRGIEGAPRGLYSGCFGWIDGSGDAELAMTIRGIELRSDDGAPTAGAGFGRARIGAGGGVTIDSDARSETAEKHLKADALIAALGA